MPLMALSFFSTWAEQAEQAMPTTGIVFFSIVFCSFSFIPVAKLQHLSNRDVTE